MSPTPCPDRPLLLGFSFISWSTAKRIAGNRIAGNKQTYSIILVCSTKWVGSPAASYAMDNISHISWNISLLRNLTSGSPYLTPTWPLTPETQYTMIRVFFNTPNLIARGHFLTNWLLVDYCVRFDSNKALHFGHEFFLPNLVVIRNFYSIRPPVDLSWPCILQLRVSAPYVIARETHSRTTL